MARAPYIHPSIFVGCPYTPELQFRAFKAALDHIPLEFHFANTAIKSRHVLDRIRSGIVRTDYSIFDITDWNANVALEIGLAEGLNRDYYIIFKPGQGARKEPPADLKGLQRFEYKALDGFTENHLTHILNAYLVKKLTHPRYIYDNLSGTTRDKEFNVAMRFLAHFKQHRVLNRRDIPNLAAGSYLRDNTLQSLIELLLSRELIKGRIDGMEWVLNRRIYKNMSF